MVVVIVHRVRKRVALVKVKPPERAVLVPVHANAHQRVALLGQQATVKFGQAAPLIRFDSKHSAFYSAVYARRGNYRIVDDEAYVYRHAL